MKPDCGGGVQYDCGRDWNTTLFLAAHLLPPSVWSCVGLNLGFGLLCFRLHSWHSLQSVLFPHQRGSATVFLLPQPLPDCCVPRAKCLPPAEPVCTGRPGVRCGCHEGLLGTVCGDGSAPWGSDPACVPLWHLSLFFPQQGTYYTQPLYAAPPHVIHHTTVVQPNGMPATVYPAPIPPPRGNGVTMGMVAGTTMAMSAGESLAPGCLLCDGLRAGGRESSPEL